MDKNNGQTFKPNAAKKLSIIHGEEDIILQTQEINSIPHQHIKASWFQPVFLAF